MQFEARARLATKLYCKYSAGANERSNEEMRQARKSYNKQKPARPLGTAPVGGQSPKALEIKDHLLPPPMLL